MILSEKTESGWRFDIGMYRTDILRVSSRKVRSPRSLFFNAAAYISQTSVKKFERR